MKRSEALKKIRLLNGPPNYENIRSRLSIGYTFQLNNAIVKLSNSLDACIDLLNGLYSSGYIPIKSILKGRRRSKQALT